MPAEPKYGLPAHTAMAGALRIGRFAKWGWWYPKTNEWPSYEGIEVKLRFPVSGELRFWRQGTPLPTSYPVGFAIPDHDPGIREREFQAAVPI